MNWTEYGESLLPWEATSVYGTRTDHELETDAARRENSRDRWDQLIIEIHMLEEDGKYLRSFRPVISVNQFETSISLR